MHLGRGLLVSPDILCDCGMPGARAHDAAHGRRPVALCFWRKADGHRNVDVRKVSRPMQNSVFTSQKPGTRLVTGNFEREIQSITKGASQAPFHSARASKAISRVS